MIRRAFLQAVVIAALAALPAALSGVAQLQTKQEEPLGPDEVRVATARQWGEKVLWVDAREEARFAEGHINGAVRLTTAEWDTLAPKFLDAWDDSQMVVIYCDGGTCEASHEVANRLREEMDLKNVFVLKGGYPAWQQQQQSR